MENTLNSTTNTINVSMQQSLNYRAELAQQMDELIEENELLLKENDFLASFINRFSGNDDVTPNTLLQGELTPAQRLVVAHYEAAQLDKEKEDLNSEFISSTINLKAMFLSTQEKLALLRRLLFQFQREVLNDQEIAATFTQNDQGVEQIVHRLPRHVNASSLKQFYEKQIQALKVGEEEYTRNAMEYVEKYEKEVKKQSKEAFSTELTEIDFEELKIENDKLQDRVATRNQEMLRIKLSAGNCMRLLNEFKSDLHSIVEKKKKEDSDVGAKETLIKQLEDRTTKTKKEIEVDNRNLQILREKEIGAHDGPQSIDYLSLKVIEQTLEKAVKETKRKIGIKKEEIENMEYK